MDEQLAVDMVHAAGCGTVLALLAHPAERRDPRLSDAIFEAVIATIATGSDDRHGAGPVPAANALRAHLPDIAALSDSERHLLDEWLARITAHATG